jgi:hypothetical protein
MILTCLSNQGAVLPDRNIDVQAGFTRETHFPITIGREYVVYAMTIRGHDVWYYILDDRNLPYPVWHPAPLFSVVDGKVPSSWRYIYTSSADDFLAVWAFPEWAQDPGRYYDQLSDRDEEALAIFSRRRQEIDVESTKDLDVVPGVVLGAGWIQCPRCTEAFKNGSEATLTRCPTCATVLRLDS